MVVRDMLSNAQVQGRPLGMAEAGAGGGVPCNAQLGWEQANCFVRSEALKRMLFEN